MSNQHSKKTPVRKWLGRAKWQLNQLAQHAFYRLPLPGSKQFTRQWWEENALLIHRQWGEDAHDYNALGELLREYGARSVLDVGCGSGRLFKLYRELEIMTVFGIDISAQALAIAHQRFPEIPTQCGHLEEIVLPTEPFDFAVCNRVLQHIPHHAIGRVVAKLCQAAKWVYVNELSDSDLVMENFYMQRHEYASLFAQHGYQVLKVGQLADQTYQLFSARKSDL